MTQVRIMRRVKNLLGLYLDQKDLKSSKKWLSYGQFTNGRLRDSSEYNVRCKGFIRASFQPEISKHQARNDQVMANLPMGGCVTPVSIMRDVRDP